MKKIRNSLPFSSIFYILKSIFLSNKFIIYIGIRNFRTRRFDNLENCCANARIVKHGKCHSYSGFSSDLFLFWNRVQIRVWHTKKKLTSVHCPNGIAPEHRRKIKTEEKAKVVASVWGAEIVQFLAVLEVLPRSIYERNGWIHPTFASLSLNPSSMLRGLGVSVVHDADPKQIKHNIFKYIFKSLQIFFLSALDHRQQK